MQEAQTTAPSQPSTSESGTYLVFERITEGSVPDRLAGAAVYVLVGTRAAAGRREAISAHVADLDERGEWTRGTPFAATTETYFFEWAPSGKKTSYS